MRAAFLFVSTKLPNTKDTMYTKVFLKVLRALSALGGEKSLEA